MSAGKVYLVGAGPGDPGLITQRAIECLGRADVVVYDYLLDDRLLELAAKAERIYVGKMGAQHAREQEEISRLLVTKAKEGKTVVRLKGGDPFVFGRGGEEAEVLAENGVPFEIVPGVSSAVAVPAYGGIPVTHRGMASSFAVITGHEDPGKPGSAINWAKLATGVDTLVFLMGMQNLPEIVAQLVANGRAAETPVAVIRDGTRPGQATCTGTLNDIVARVKEQKLGPPAVVVVGEVVKLREKLHWFNTRPLFGKTALVTRARSQASSLSRLLAEQGARPVELPAIAIEPLTDFKALDAALARLGDYQWLVLTSVNGVEAFFQRLQFRNMDARVLHGLKIGAIGTATAEALAAHGIRADYVPEEYTSEGFVAGLAGRTLPGERFLLARADIADRQLVAGIQQMGGWVTEVAAYRTVPAGDGASAEVTALLNGEIDFVTFTSSSTVTNLMARLGGKTIPAGTKVACIGPKTAETAVAAGLKVDIMAQEHTIPGLVAAIAKYTAGEALC